MKSILLALLVLPTHLLTAQTPSVKVSKYPMSYSKILDQYKLIDYGDAEVWGYQLDGNERRTRQYVGNGGFYGKYTSTSDVIMALEAKYKDSYRSKGQVVITDIKADNKKYGGFKVSTNGKTPDTGMAFTSNGEYIIAVSLDGNQLVYTKYDVKAKKVTVKGQKITINDLPSSIVAVAASGINNYICISTKEGDYIIIDTDSNTGKKWATGTDRSLDKYKYIYPSTSSDHFLLLGKDQIFLVEAKTGKVVYSQSIESKSQTTSSFFVSNEPSSKVVKKIEKLSLTKAGIGVVSTANSLIVFDTDRNFFTLTNQETVDVLEYVKFTGLDSPLEAQPDLIPIISDVLNPKKVALLFEQTSLLCQKYNNRNFAFQVFESAEPFSNETIQILSQSKAQYVIEYMGKYVTQWVNNTPKTVLAEAGKEVNIERNDFIESYATLVRNLSGDEYAMYLADPSEIENAKEKLKSLTADLYYMTVDELIEKGNNSLGMAAMMGSNAALLAIKFYEVAAEKEPNEAVHQLFIANAYANAEVYDKSLEHYNKALAMKPDYPLALFGITKTSFVPVQQGKKTMNETLAKSIIENANRYLAVAPEHYQSETKTVKTFKGFSQLYLDDQGLYAAYNLATGISDIEKRSNAVAQILPKIEATGNTYFAASAAFSLGFDFSDIAESKDNNALIYMKADVMFDKAVKGGVYDAKLYYEWAGINLYQINQVDEGFRIVAEAKKIYPTNENFDKLTVNAAFNKGRELYMSKSYSKAIPHFENYIANSSDVIPKAYDYLGVACYKSKSYAKAAKNLQLLKENESSNTLKAYYPNFDAVLAYAKNPRGTAPVLKDNGAKIEQMEDRFADASDKGESELKTMEEVASYFDQINYDYGQAVTHSTIGVYYHRQGNTRVARGHYGECITAGARSSSCYNNLALIFISEKSMESAKTMLEGGLEKFPDARDLPLTFAKYYKELAYTDYENEYFSSAISNFKQCISYNNKDAMAHLYLGYSYYGKGNTSDAKYWMKKAVNIDSNLLNEYPSLRDFLY